MSPGRVYAHQQNKEDEINVNKTGDLTQDGQIDKKDVSKFSDYFMGQETKANNSDTNEDGNTNIADYVNIKSYVAQE